MALRVRVPQHGAGFQGNLFYRPSATSAAGGWLTEVGSATLQSVLDETIADDADYIRSTTNPNLDLCKIAMTVASATRYEAQPVVVSYRCRKQGGAVIDLRVRLLEGTTERRLCAHSASTPASVTANHTLRSGDVAVITDCHNL